MPRLIVTLFEICLLRRGPQDLPHNPQLALAALVALVVVKLLTSYGTGDQMGLAVPVALASAVFSIAAVRLILRWAGNESRFWQTFLALAAIGLIFVVAAAPFRIMIGPIDPGVLDGSVPLPRGSLAVALLNLWQLIVIGHIWRHALETRLPVGVLVAIAVVLVELVLMILLFASAVDPVATTAPAS